MEQKSIVVFGIGKRRQTLEFFRQEAHKRKLKLVGCDASLHSVASSAVDEFIRVPYVAEGVKYIESVQEILRRTNALGFTSLIDPELAPMATIEAEGCRFLNCDSRSASICEDKFVFSQELSARSIPCIPTFLEPLEVFPQICKDRSGSCGSNFRYIENIDQIPRHTKGLIFQPFLGGTHYCVDAYFDLSAGGLRGLCVKEVMSKKNGETYIAKTVQPGPFQSLIERVAKTIPLRGICNFDIYEQDGELVLMEINPRIGGNYPMTHKAGLNFVSIMLDELLGRTQDNQELSYKENVIFGKAIEVFSIQN